MSTKSAEQSAHADLPDSTRADARRNREAVIEAAIGALAADPNASMSDIADAAGLGRTTVYRHFENRDELIVALFERVITEAEAATGAVIGEGGSAKDVLRALGPVMVEIGERFRFLHSHMEIGAALLADSKAIPDDPVRLFLLEAQARGEIREDAPLSWMQSTMQATAMATMDEVHVGHLSLGEAGRLLGETFVATYATGSERS